MALYVITANPADQSNNNISTSQHLTGGTAMTLNGTTGGILEIPRIIKITNNAGDYSSHSFVITGTDARGSTISETLAGPNAGSVVSVYLYQTVTSIVPSTTDGTNNYTVGTTNTTLSAESNAATVSDYVGIAPMVSVEVTGTINFTVYETFDNPFVDNMMDTGCNWYSVTNLATKTANTRSQISVGASAVKTQINSYTNGATLKMVVVTGKKDTD